jgi:predicted lipoprotein
MPTKKSTKKKKPSEAETLQAKIERAQLEYKLDVVDKQILKLKSLDPRLDIRTIAEKVGMHYATISKRMDKPAFRRAWDAINETTFEIMERNAKKAAYALGKLIDEDDKRIKLEAIKLSLSPILNNHTHQVAVSTEVVYKTTVQPDSSLLQQVIEGEVVDEK